MRDYVFIEGGLQLTFRVFDGGRVALTYFGADTGAEECPGGREVGESGEKFDGTGMSPVEIALSGSGFIGHHGGKKTRGAASEALRFSGLEDFSDAGHRHVVLKTESEELYAEMHCIFFGGTARTYSAVRAKKTVTAEYISSLNLPVLFEVKEKRCYEDIRWFVPHNSWHGEAQWRDYSLSQLGLTGCHDNCTLKRIYFCNTGSWSSKEYLPAGFLTDGGGKWCNWQIEANGSWYAEVGGGKDRIYCTLSGPTFAESGWRITLRPGERFETVKAAVTFGADIEDCVKKMTEYRRSCFAVYPADAALPAQYNGYMHANWEMPQTERLLAQIDRTAELGLPYFVVDAGWFCKGDRDFWPILGDWLHPEEPFSMPLKEIFDHARGKGLKCGLWIEIEDVGAECAALPRLASMLMKRDGVPVCENDRYFLDFSLRETREYATEVIDFLVEKYGVGYFKIDYNTDCISGGNADAESFGEGLLRHNRAYLAWLRGIREKYPNLLIEGCASGGLRSDYATLYECALGNISDQVHYDRVPYIVSNAAAYLVPEHTGVWAYPREGASAEEIRMNFVNAAFFRLQLSGALDKMDEAQMQEIREGVAFCESLRDFRRHATAFFPLGFCKFFDETVAYGYRSGEKAYLAVYHLGGAKRKEIPLSFRGRARVAYPAAGGAAVDFSDGVLIVSFQGERDACIVELRGEI